MKDQLLKALMHRKDQYALDIIREHPDLIDENIIRSALDHGCVKVIRYLREHDLYTAEGALERQRIRDERNQRSLDELDKHMPDLEKLFD